MCIRDRSHLIYAIVQMVNQELRQPGDIPDDAIVILTAHTGTAAYAIRGQTLHSAFMISVKGIATLSAEQLAMLRNKFPKLILIIIDEVSMVGASLLKLVHERCAATRELPLALPFAGISVLAIGDFQQLLESHLSTNHREVATSVSPNFGCQTLRSSNSQTS